MRIARFVFFAGIICSSASSQNQYEQEVDNLIREMQTAVQSPFDTLVKSIDDEARSNRVTASGVSSGKTSSGRPAVVKPSSQNSKEPEFVPRKPKVIMTTVYKDQEIRKCLPDEIFLLQDSIWIIPHSQGRIARIFGLEGGISGKIFHTNDSRCPAVFVFDPNGYLARVAVRFPKPIGFDWLRFLIESRIRVPFYGETEGYGVKGVEIADLGDAFVSVDGIAQIVAVSHEIRLGYPEKLGFTTIPIDADVRAREGIPRQISGLLIDKVISGSAAETKGIRAGMILTSYGRHWDVSLLPVQGFRQVVALVESAPLKEKTIIKLLNKGKDRIYSVP